MFDEGSGPPLVVVPGVQGRWEWMKPALEELARRCRTVSYSLCGDFGSRRRLDPAIGFENYLQQLDAVLDEAGLERTALCGVSYGGLIAVKYAATRPHRVSALILSSAPAPGWVPTTQQQRWVARPWLSTPAFVLTSPARLMPEVASALPGWGRRIGFSVRHLARVAAAPAKPPLMASRVRWQQSMDFTTDCQRIAVPTLVVTGEDELDRVVPAVVTRRYCELIRTARYERLEATGHIGLLTRPRRYAELVTGFVHDVASEHRESNDGNSH